jgi:hypothetical protein
VIATRRRTIRQAAPRTTDPTRRFGDCRPAVERHRAADGAHARERECDAAQFDGGSLPWLWLDAAPSTMNGDQPIRLPVAEMTPEDARLGDRRAGPGAAATGAQG